MPTTASAAAVALKSGIARQTLETDLLFVPVFDGEKPRRQSPAWMKPPVARCAGRRRERRVPGPGIRAVPHAAGRIGAATRVALIGAGKAADFDTERLRKVATAAALAARSGACRGRLS